MRHALIVIAGMITAAALEGQTNTAYRDAQMKMLEHQRKVLLQMADSMPERLYRDKVTSQQRDFAGQIHHAASAVAGIARSTMAGPGLSLPDTTTAFNTRAGLRSYINGAYDYATNLLRSQTDASRAETADLFGMKLPRWQIWDELHMHTVWTAGQVVANFRKHGMGPPAFSFF
jgi:hypothetical protein